MITGMGRTLLQLFSSENSSTRLHGNQIYIYLGLLDIKDDIIATNC